MNAALARAALASRCPRCGKGALFRGFLAIAPACAACGENFRAADVGDGAAVFVTFLVGAIAVPFALTLQMGFGVAPLATLALSVALAGALALVLLRPIKALLFALQWRFRARAR